jgi:hypothetical protein
MWVLFEGKIFGHYAMLYSLLKEFNNKKTKHTDKASSPYFSVIKKKLACYKKLPLMKSHQTSYT